MKLRTLRFFSLACGLVVLTGCELPPREAWRVIRHEGLIPYLAIEWGNRPIPAYVRLPRAQPSAKAPCLACVPESRSRVASRYLDTGSASSVAATPAVSRAATVAPSPPDVAKRAVIPAASGLVAAPSPPPRPAPARIQEPPPRALPAPPEPVAATKPAPAAPPPAEKPPEPKPAPTVATTPKSEPTPAAPAPAAPADQIPYGTPVPGRPGLVNSPFAGKYQLVDVTGLPAGQEVKCPYTGKLFRVPPAAQAANQVPAPTPPPLPTTPPEGEKKP